MLVGDLDIQQTLGIAASQILMSSGDKGHVTYINVSQINCELPQKQQLVFFGER